MTMISIALISLTIIGVAVGRYPMLRMNRTTIAVVGATALIACGSISLPQAYAALDLDTLVLLFAMMIINANLRLAGFFQLLAHQLIKRMHTPRQMLAGVIVLSGLLSALFLNDTVVLMFTPLVVEVVLALRRDPIPYLIGLGTAANIGSVATITGNPQNMIIGIAGEFTYIQFSRALLPVALIGLGIAWIVILLLFPAEFTRAVFVYDKPKTRLRVHRPLLIKGCVALTAMLVAFLAGAAIPVAALAAASLLLITRRLKPERVFSEMDDSLLFFFAGLFVVTGAIESSGLSGHLFARFHTLAAGGIVPLTTTSAVLSNLISNVPAVLLFRPLVPSFPDPQQTWLTLAMATTLAGNLTLLGSVANLIVAESARRYGVRLTFGAFLRAGIPITLLSLLAGILWLMIIA